MPKYLQADYQCFSQGARADLVFTGVSGGRPGTSLGHFTLLSPLQLEEIFSPPPVRLIVSPSRLLRLEMAGLKTVLCKFTGSLSKSFDQISASLDQIWCHFDTRASVVKIEMYTVDHLPSACIYSTVKHKFSLAPLQYHSKSFCFFIFFSFYTKLTILTTTVRIQLQLYFQQSIILYCSRNELKVMYTLKIQILFPLVYHHQVVKSKCKLGPSQQEYLINLNPIFFLRFADVDYLSRCPCPIRCI